MLYTAKVLRRRKDGHVRPPFCYTRPWLQACLLCLTADISALTHSRHVCHVTQQTCLLCEIADMSAVSHSRHVCCVTQQTCLLCGKANSLLCYAGDMSALSHGRRFCCVTQQACRPCHTTDMSSVYHSRHVCCGPQQTCLLCHTTDCCVKLGEGEFGCEGKGRVSDKAKTEKVPYVHVYMWGETIN